MNLPEIIRAYTSDLRHRFRGKTWHAGNPGPPLDDLDLVADIIDSLPTAEDGSVIVPGRWAVCKRWDDDDMLNVEVAEINSIEFWRDRSGHVFYSDHPVSMQGFDYVLSTHRTREEAEAAAAKAGEIDL